MNQGLFGGYGQSLSAGQGIGNAALQMSQDHAEKIALLRLAENTRGSTDEYRIRAGRIEKIRNPGAGFDYEATTSAAPAASSTTKTLLLLCN